MKDKIIAAYEKHRNLKLAAEELGMKWQSFYSNMVKYGIPVTGDKLKYGSDKDRLAARAELEFQRLVPKAINQNSIKWQSKIDFTFNNLKIDIKASKLHKGSANFDALRWAFSIKKQEFCADFVVCFAFKNEGYKLLLIPGELVRHYSTISISENGKSKWLQYIIEPDELNEFFTSLHVN